MEQKLNNPKIGKQEGRKGTFYAVSVGPGDPELMTLQAVRLLEQTPVIAALVNPMGRMTAWEIVSQAVDLTQKQLIRIPSGMERDPEMRRQEHLRQCALIRPLLDEGKDVAMLTLGDVSIYSSAMYLLEHFLDEGYQTVMLPGVPSFCAAASALNISLTDIDHPVHIIPSAFVEMEEALELKGTKVLMKSGHQLREVLRALEAAGCEDRTWLAANCGMPGVLLCSDIRQLSDIPGYYTTIIVKED